MNVLLMGSGGREHALAWKLAQSPLLTKLYAAPGNPGIAEHAELVALDPADHRAVDRLLPPPRRSALVVIGPEAPLVDGLADNLRAIGILAFGPNKAPAQLEGSKGFTKDLCAREGIPTARYARASDRLAAEAALEDFGLPVVIKADGLAAGKGVIIAETEAEAAAALDHVRRRLRRCRRRGRHRGISWTARRRASSPRRRRDRRPVRLRPGPQAGRRRRHRAQYRRHGRLQPGGDLHPGDGAAGDGRDRPPDGPRARGAGHALFGRALCRADADRRGAEADRI